jgi:hypothetical protein
MTVSVKKKISRLPIAPIIAVLFAGAAGALVLATPEWLLNKWISASGLNTVLSAANPPLGMKARVLIAAAVAVPVAVATFAAAFSLGRVLGRKKTVKSVIIDKPIETFAKSDAVAEQTGSRFDQLMGNAPAPAGFSRPPIFAQRELGAPFMADQTAEARTQAAPQVVAEPISFEPVAAAAPIPVAPVVPHYDVPAYQPPTYALDPVVAPVAVSAVPETAPTPQPIAAFDPFLRVEQPIVAEPAYVATAMAAEASAEDELVLGTEQIADIPEPAISEPAISASTNPEPATLGPVFVAAAAPVQPSWMVPQDEAPAHVASAASPVAVDAPPALDAIAPQSVAPQPLSPVEVDAAPINEQSVAAQALVAADADAPSLSELMSRFETGIRRRQLSNLVSGTSLTNGPVSTGAAADAALRDALGTLERLAASAR